MKHPNHIRAAEGDAFILQSFGRCRSLSAPSIQACARTRQTAKSPDPAYGENSDGEHAAKRLFERVKNVLDRASIKTVALRFGRRESALKPAFGTQFFCRAAAKSATKWTTDLRRQTALNQTDWIRILSSNRGSRTAVDPFGSGSLGGPFTDENATEKPLAARPQSAVAASGFDIRPRNHSDRPPQAGVLAEASAC